MSLPLLIITDGTTTVDLLSRTGYHLSDWRPAIAAFKNDGIRRSSVISEGSRLVGYQYDNVVETFTLDLDERLQDGAARQLITLNRLLVKGVDYWARSGVNEPVWIAARSGDEQYTRYATVMNYKMDSIGNPYGAEFIGIGIDKVGMIELVLTIERGHWMENPPKVGVGQEIHNTWTNINTGVISGREDYTAATPQFLYTLVANKFSNSNITHVYTRTAGGAFSANLVANPFAPHALLPNPVANGDSVCFGSADTANTEGGPFNCLAFDITAPGAIYAGGATGIWQYWDVTAAAWHNCEYYYDRSAVAVNQPLSWFGECSVHWTQYTTAGENWGMATPAGYPAAAWWIRMVVTIGGGASITVPSQQNRNVYTANQACVVIDEPDVKGDVDAITLIQAQVVSDQYVATPNMHRDADSLIVGLRSTDREGAYAGVFNAYINLSDRQLQAGLIPAILDAVTCVWDASEPGSSTGHGLHYTAAGVVPMTPSVTVAFDHLYVRSYFGKYRAFLRYRIDPVYAATVFNLKTQLSLMQYTLFGAVPTWATISESAIVSGAYTSGWEYFVWDMGIITIPGMPLDASNYLDRMTGMNLVVSFQALAAIEAWVYDIVLIPCDEWMCAVEIPQYPIVAGKMSVADWARIEIDSISMPTELVRSKIINFNSSTYASLRTVTNGKAILHPHREQKYWFLCSRHDGASGPRTCGPDIVLGVGVQRSQRYLTLRGSE